MECYQSILRAAGSHKREGAHSYSIGYRFRDLGERMGFLFIYFWMKLLHSSLNFNKTVPLRKASEAIKRKERVCVPLPRGETQQLPYSGKTFICRLNSKWIHLHLPSQPAPGAGWMTHNATQMSLPSRVHQLKLINIPPHAEDAPPAQRAAGHAMAEHDDSRSGRGSRSPGQQVYLAGSREGHSEALASLAHILCRQSWVVYKSRAEGIWLQRELSILAFRAQSIWAGVPYRSTGCHSL